MTVALGGVMWAVTPLRQPVFGAGRDPGEGVLFFRAYNLYLLVAVALMTVGLLETGRQRRAGRHGAFSAGWWCALAGHVLLFAGSLPAVVLGGQWRTFVMGAQDVGFLGAVVSAAGAMLFGTSALRQASMPRTAAILFVATLPSGVLGVALLEVLGVPEDYLGLPLTVTYGGAWLVLGTSWARSTKRHIPLGSASG